MKYAVTTANTAPEASVYSTSIPAKTDAGTYYVWYKAVGDDNHTDSEAACVTVTISDEDMTNAIVTLKKTSYTYDGSAKKPAVKSVVLNGRKLRAGTDYTVSYKNNKKLGTATAIVTGKGSYSGFASAIFSISAGVAFVGIISRARTLPRIWTAISISSSSSAFSSHAGHGT